MPSISTVFNPYKKPRDSIAVAPIMKDELMRHGRLGRSRGVMAAAWVVALSLLLAWSCMVAMVRNAAGERAMGRQASKQAGGVRQTDRQAAHGCAVVIGGQHSSTEEGESQKSIPHHQGQIEPRRQLGTDPAAK